MYLYTFSVFASSEGRFCFGMQVWDFLV